MIKLKPFVTEALTQQREPRAAGYSETAWDWRTQAPGSHWKTRSGTWGARSMKGGVAYFKTEPEAAQHAQGSWVPDLSGKPGSAVPPKGAVAESVTIGKKGPTFSTVADAKQAVQNHVEHYLENEGWELVYDEQGHATYEVSVAVTLKRH